jgi:hypothetical protein
VLVGFLVPRLEFSVERFHSIEQTTRFGEHVSSSWRSSVVWAVDGLCASFTAWLAVSRVGAAIWVLVVAQVAVFQPFGSDVVAVVDGDVAVAGKGLGHEIRGLGVCLGAVGRIGSVCHHLGAVGNRSGGAGTSSGGV